MSDHSPISRREALLAATALGTVAAVAEAAVGDDKIGIPENPKDPGKVKDSAPFKVSVTLTDGQVVNLKAIEATIDFGGAGQLRVMPTGVMPVLLKPHPDHGKNGFDDPKKI